MTLNLKRNLLTGVATAIPILVTLFVFSFFLDLLSGLGRPKVVFLANAVRPMSPDLARWVLEVPWLSSTLAILLTLGMFYLLGMAMSRLVGRQAIHAVESLFHRIPLVANVYGATKKLIDAFQSDSARAQRVVLIEFPHSRMKAVGLVTRILRDEDTDEELAAVYVPTAPNPTGGYLEIVPVADLVTLDWTVDEAMAFVLSGGTTGPERIRFGRRAGRSGGNRDSIEAPGERASVSEPPRRGPQQSDQMPWMPSGDPAVPPSAPARLELVGGDPNGAEGPWGEQGVVAGGKRVRLSGSYRV